MAEEVMLTEHLAIVEFPEDAVEVTIIAKVYHDGELITVNKVLTMQDLRAAFRKADDGYVDDDDRFVITDKGRDFLEKMGDM